MAHSEQIVDSAPGLPMLGAPVPLMVEQLVGVLDALLPIAEQVIHVPKIIFEDIPSRTPLREPQLAEPLVELPTEPVFVEWKPELSTSPWYLAPLVRCWPRPRSTRKFGVSGRRLHDFMSTARCIWQSVVLCLSRFLAGGVQESGFSRSWLLPHSACAWFDSGYNFVQFAASYFTTKCWLDSGHIFCVSMRSY